MPTATIRSDVEHPETVTSALRPDNTESLTTTVEDGCVVTTIERETTASLEATLDDYIVTLDVATSVVTNANQHTRSNP
jgi:tRNA threonylcarbamoyladenosine modification (KEOPS) complex  Pcc1 subunit